MSLIDPLNHSIVDYDPKSTKAFTGQRLSKVTYKTITDKDNPLCGVKRPSKCVSLPMIAVGDVTDNVAALAPMIVETLHGIQDKIVRERVDAGAASISMEEISIAACIEYFESNNESGRLTKESVATWFDETIGESLAVTLADKLGISSTPSNEESEKILAVVSAFKDKVSSLAGGKTSFEPKVCKSLINAIDLAPSGDVLATRFKTRLQKMMDEANKGADLLALL